MSKTVLIIEDNEANAYLVSYILRDRGLKVVEARDGAEGIRLAQENPPDLILLDIQLPGMSGYEVAQELTAIETLDGVPIIAVTSHAMPGDRERSIEAGCVAYIEKPIQPDSFGDEIERHLGLK